jgi:hypothetical protein
VRRLKFALIFFVIFRFATASEAISAGEIQDWDSVIRLTFDPADQRPGFSYQKSIAVNPTGSIYVFWLDDRNSFPQLWYRRFDPAGRIWLPESQLTRLAITCNLPAAASDGQGNIHLLWHVDAENIPALRGIWYQRFDARAGRWLPETLIAPAPLPYNLKYPAVGVTPGSEAVHIVYCGNPDTGGLPQVFHKEFMPGTGWLPAEQLTTSPESHKSASVAVDSSNDLCVVWLGQDLGAQCLQVYARCRIGGVWQPIEQVSDLPGGLTQYSPAVAVGARGYWHIVWAGQYLNHFYEQIFYRCRSPAGWSEIFTLSRFVPYSQYSPSITTTGNRCFVVWTGKSPAAPETTQLLFAGQNDSGIWTEPSPLTGFTATRPDQPAIVAAVDSGLHIAFCADSAGNLDVFYLAGRRNPSGIREKHHASLCPARLLTTFPGPGIRVYSPAGMEIGAIRAAGVYLIELQHSGARRFQKVIFLRGKN